MAQAYVPTREPGRQRPRPTRRPIPSDREAFVVRPRPFTLAAVFAVAVAGVAAVLVAVAAGGSRAAGPDRTVVVTMHHSHFEPALVRVAPAERVRFVLRNTDPIDHELILGDAAVQARHERGRERHHHGDVPGERSVAAGTEATTTYVFPSGWDGRSVEFACHLPGHYAYGMRGTVRVGSA
jgi:uncharacterized cupredoxin-like copper-binding protein